MLKRLLEQCHLVLCFCTCMGGIILRIQKKESANGTSLCIVLTAAQKATAGMETHLGRCPVREVYVQSVSSFGHSAALLSDMLSDTSSEIPPPLPQNRGYVFISSFNILIPPIIFNIAAFDQMVLSNSPRRLMTPNG